jgi:hypothetical protein
LVAGNSLSAPIGTMRASWLGCSVSTKTFQAGNVLGYEPLLTAENQAFFVEDTFLITLAGHEVINPTLPYSPADIERAMLRK